MNMLMQTHSEYFQKGIEKFNNKTLWVIILWHRTSSVNSNIASDKNANGNKIKHDVVNSCVMVDQVVQIVIIICWCDIDIGDSISPDYKFHINNTDHQTCFKTV